MSGIPRTTINSLLSREVKRMDPETLRRLSESFGKEGDILYEVAGYAKTEAPRSVEESYDELLTRARLASPLQVPVYSEFTVHAGAEHRVPEEYFYLPKATAAGDHIEAYIVHGHCLTPKVEQGDVVIVDRDVMVEHGRMIICLVDGEICVGRYEKRGEECWLKNNDESFQIREPGFCRVIIGIYKRP
jgi:SOS-response transcriptional repressor LexA